MQEITELIELLAEKRKSLIQSKNWEEYRNILDFMENPKYSGDIQNDGLFKMLFDFYNNFRSDYKVNILEGQCEIWNTFINTYSVLEKISDKIDRSNITYYDNDYRNSSKEVISLLDYLAEVYKEIYIFEETMGIDRFLSVINTFEIDILNKKVIEIRVKLNKILIDYKYLFVEKYGNFNVPKVILNSFGIDGNMTNISRNFSQSNNKALLILIDGMGFSQYLWNQKLSKSKNRVTYSENILSWLKNNELINENFILGSSYVSDTGAGLSQIFSGELPNNTNVISSKFSDGNYLIDIKRTEKEYYLEKIISNYKYRSFLGEAKKNNIMTKVYYGSQYSENPFAKYCFGETEVVEVANSERIFSLIFDDWNSKSSTEKEFDVIYYSNIDNKGHTTGAFTSFEYHEYQKFNLLFTNFIIQLAISSQELFNGQTSIYITADHGMAESSKKNIDRVKLTELLKQDNPQIRVIENNRAVLVYGINDIDKCVVTIEKFMDENKCNCIIKTKNDDLINRIYGKSKYVPDIIVSLEDEGLFLGKSVNQFLYHFAGHGGLGIEEVFVPMIEIKLTEKMLEMIKQRYLKMS